MKRCRIVFFVVFMCLFIGCGSGDKMYYDIQANYEALVFPENADIFFALGSQYYEGEEIKFASDRQGNVLWCRDGQEWSAFLSAVPSEYLSPSAHWWLDEEGSIFVLYDNKITLLDKEGNWVRTVTSEGNVTDICRGKTGEYIVCIQDTAQLRSGFAKLDKESGELGKTEWRKDSIYGIGTGYEKDVLVVTSMGICDYGLADGEQIWYMKWNGTSYEQESAVEDIRFISDNQITLLTREDMIVELKKVNVADAEKIILTYKTTRVSQLMKELIVQFNQENENYQIQIIECEDGEDYFAFRDKVQAEIAAGHGPDILDDFSVRNLGTLQKKGALLELTDYIRSSAIDEAAYYPVAFQNLLGDTEQVYAISAGMIGVTVYTRSEVKENVSRWDMVEVLDYLENYPKNTMFIRNLFSYIGAENVLSCWLARSDSLYGRVDWEKKTCEFNENQWYKMLELAKKYGDIEETGKYLSMIASFGNLGYYAAYDNTLTGMGFVDTGYPGEDGGIHLVSPNISIGINAASSYSDGAWQFLEFLLQQETQLKIGKSLVENAFPVHRQTFDIIVKDCLENGEQYDVTLYGKDLTITTGDVTEEDAEKIRAFFSDAVQSSNKNAEILKIIEEEAAAYFEGYKSGEEVTRIIQNRVQLYLDELP